MLALVSDLHFSDGSTAHNVDPGAFDLLGADIEGALKHKKPNDVQIVLLGDIIDLVRTDYWERNEIAPGERPWGGGLDPGTAININAAAVEKQFGDILNAILAGASFQGLATMLKGLGEKVGKPVRVTYVIGNHDRMLHNFPVLKNKIATALNPVSVTFETRLPSTSVTDWPYGVLARHGHEFDEACHGWEFYRRVLNPGSPVGRFNPAVYRVQALGEVITAELMSGFIARLGKVVSPAVLDEYKDVNNLRPMTAVFSWIAWLLRQPSSTAAPSVVIAALRTSLGAVLGCSLAKRWDDLKPDLIVSGDLTDYLSKLHYLLTKRGGIDLLERVLPIVDELQAKLNISLDSTDSTLFKAAEREATEGEAAPADIQFILYGHSHDARYDCFRGRVDGRVKMYVNTGTFLSFIDRTLDGRGFFTSHRLSYVLVYAPEEDPDQRRDHWPTMDVWNGLRFKRYTYA